MHVNSMYVYHILWAVLLTIGIRQYPIVVAGYHYGIVVSFCRCKTKVERLVELHLWPATPQSPRVAFTMELLDIIHASMLECQVSLHHASGMLQYLSTLKMVCTCILFLEKICLILSPTHVMYRVNKGKPRTSSFLSHFHGIGKH